MRAKTKVVAVVMACVMQGDVNVKHRTVVTTAHTKHARTWTNATAMVTAMLVSACATLAMVVHRVLLSFVLTTAEEMLEHARTVSASAVKDGAVSIVWSASVLVAVATGNACRTRMVRTAPVNLGGVVPAVTN